ncbi:MAG TPA: pepsin/retropepsin-like aspartic protease family protein [Rhizomicrobium sp.]
MRMTFVSALALAAFAAAPAWADCKPLALVTSLDFKTTDDGLQIIVPITIAGHDGNMLVDSGAWVSQITNDAVDKFGLERLHGVFGSMNVSGQETTAHVMVPAKLGRLQGSNYALQVWPGGPFSPDPSVIGLIGSDILKKFDVDVDMTNKKFNLLSQDHCEGKVIYWPTSAVAIVPFTLMYDGKIQLTVKLDGRPVVAVLDTGADTTTLAQNVAEGNFGLKLGSADAPETGSLPGRSGAKTYEHTFTTLDFEGVAVANPHISIIPDLFRSANEVDSSAHIGTHFADPRMDSSRRAMLLGMNIMRHFHFYIAYKEEKVYITPAAAPAPAPAEAPAH